MRKTLVSLLALVSTVIVAPSSGVAATALATETATGLDCATDGLTYPGRWRAEGATFVGRVRSMRVIADDFTVYRFDVERVHRGRFRDRVQVRSNCAPLEMTVGKRYLVTSSWTKPASGEIDAVVFNDHTSAVWQVSPTEDVRLFRYGAVFGPPPWYLSRPETLHQAVHAVAYGRYRTGQCEGGDDHRMARYQMEVDRIDGRLEVVVRIDGRPGRTWTVRLLQNDRRFFRHTVPDTYGFTIIEDRPDTAGPDRIHLRARQGDGQVCEATITF